MATVYLSLSTMASGEKKQVMVRFSHGKVNQRAKSGIFVYPDNWDQKKQMVVMPRGKMMTDHIISIINELREADAQLRQLTNHIIDSYTSSPDSPLFDKEWLKNVVSVFRYGEPEPEVIDFWGAWELFIQTKKVSKGRTAVYRVVRSQLQRFEQVKRMQNKSFALSFDTLTSFILTEYDAFLRNELIYAKKYPSLYTKVKLNRIERGSNCLATKFSVLRTFCNWAVNKELTTNNPFTKYSIKPAVYGSPIYISKEERDILYSTNMRNNHLNVVKDMFVLQCLLGCRVGDYFKMTKTNIVDDAIEYIAGKTADERPITVRVPLTAKAKEILAKYPVCKNNKLMPFISTQKYNDYIKECFREAGLTRLVTTLDTITGQPIQVPICDVASSHMARRTFVGNLYKQVQDPNLIGALSGHCEGSKAFARYRDIDEDLKRKTVSLLE